MLVMSRRWWGALERGMEEAVLQLSICFVSSSVFKEANLAILYSF
jgi:hypothetical protein